jgi:hypothetical protein
MLAHTAAGFGEIDPARRRVVWRCLQKLALSCGDYSFCVVSDVSVSCGYAACYAT